jgi:NAD(P)-dependent dehydrogenase (short-subunit alcohol dehydrogenase family)
MDLGARIRGQRIFVTGASGGLGEHFAKVCARNGAAVVVGARRREKLDSLVAELKGLGAAEALAVDLDVADEASVEAALSAAGPLTCSSTTPGSRAAAPRSTPPPKTSTASLPRTSAACG